MRTQKTLLDDVKQACRTMNGKPRLPCAAAFRLAKRHGVSVGRIGRLCDRAGIRIRRCQLGCFP